MDLPASAVIVGADLPGESELIVPAGGVFAHHQPFVSQVHLRVGAITGLQGRVVSRIVEHTVLVSPGIPTVGVGLYYRLLVLIIASHTVEHLVCRVRGVRRV